MNHIDRHLYEELSVDALSNLANFSKFHFHRQFAGYCGVNVSRYIQLMRLRRASYRLAFNPLDRITDVSLDAGFENPESFSRAFKNMFGQAPRAFRKKPDWEQWSRRYQFLILSRERTSEMIVRIVTTQSILIGALEHTGSPALVNASVQRFIEWRKASGLSPVHSSQSYGIPYNDPNTTPPDDFHFDICGSVATPVPSNPQGVATKTIPGGRCAVVTHAGSRDRISDSVYRLYREWLPNSGEELRDFPVYFHYLNPDHNTPEHEHLTDVYLPLK